MIDYLDKYYQKHNRLTMVGLSIMGTNGYAFVSRFAVVVGSVVDSSSGEALVAGAGSGSEVGSSSMPPIHEAR